MFAPLLRDRGSGVSSAYNVRARGDRVPPAQRLRKHLQHKGDARVCKRAPQMFRVGDAAMLPRLQTSAASRKSSPCPAFSPHRRMVCAADSEREEATELSQLVDSASKPAPTVTVSSVCARPLPHWLNAW